MLIFTIALLLARLVFGFTNPTQAPPGGGGAISVGASGNGGMGTATPSAQLHIIRNEVRTSGGHFTADNNRIINIGPAAGNKLWIRKTTVSGDSSSYTDLMVVENTGNVGIGTTGPGSTLDVGGASNSAFIQNLATWGLNARTQGLIIIPEGTVTDNGAGGLTLGTDNQGNHQHTIRMQDCNDCGGTVSAWRTGASSPSFEGITSNTGAHTHSITSGFTGNQGSVAGTNAPYIQLLACQKS